MRTAVVTGSAGFIGFHLSRRLLDQGWRVVGVDSHNDYYDPALKQARLATLEGRPGFRFQRHDIADAEGTAALEVRFRASPIRIRHHRRGRPPRGCRRRHR